MNTCLNNSRDNIWNCEIDIFIHPSFINFKIPINIQNYVYNLLEKNKIIIDKHFLKFLWFCASLWEKEFIIILTKLENSSRRKKLYKIEKVNMLEYWSKKEAIEAIWQINWCNRSTNEKIMTSIRSTFDVYKKLRGNSSRRTRRRKKR